MNILSTFVIPGIGLVLTLAFGILLGRTGRPYSGLLFNIHKLLAVAAVAATAVQMIRAFKGVVLSALSIALLALAALCVVALFLGGALMNTDKFDHAMLNTFHWIATAALIAALPAAVFLLARRV